MGQVATRPTGGGTYLDRPSDLRQGSGEPSRSSDLGPGVSSRSPTADPSEVRHIRLDPNKETDRAGRVGVFSTSPLCRPQSREDTIGNLVDDGYRLFSRDLLVRVSRS